MRLETIQDGHKLRILLEILILEIAELVHLAEVDQDLLYVEVIDWEQRRLVMAAELARKRVKALSLPIDGNVCDVIHEGKVTFAEAPVNIQRMDMLRHREDAEDVGAVEIVEGGGLDQDVIDVGVVRVGVKEELVQGFLL